MMATTNNKTDGVVDPSTQEVKSSASKPLWTRDGGSMDASKKQKQHIAKQIASAEEQIDSYVESSAITGDNESSLTSPIHSCYECTAQNNTEASCSKESDDMFHFGTSEETEGDNAPGTDLLGQGTLTNPGDGDTYYESALEPATQRKDAAAANDVSVPRQEILTQDVHNDVNESAISLQPSSINATSILTPTHRRNSSISRRGIRAINHMESISETGNDSSEHNQLIDMDIGNNNNDEAAAVASNSSSYSTPRRRRRMRTSGGESTESVGGNSGSTGSERGSRGSGSRLRRSRRQGDRSNPSSSTDNNSEENNEDENTRRRRPVRSSSSNALAASLDAGMSSLRRWIRSRRLSLGGGEPRPGAGTSSGHSVSSMTTMRLGEEDIFALSHTGSDPRRITSAAPSSTGSDPNIFESNSSSGFLYYRPFEVHVQNDVDVDSAIYASDDESGTRSILLHPLISSENTVSINSTDEGGSQQQSRQRAFSEPSRASIREFFSSVYGSRAIDGMNDEPDETVTTRRLRGGLRLQHNRSASMSSAVPTSPMIAEEEVEEVDATDQQNNEQIGDQTLATRSIDEPNILQSLSFQSGNGQLDTSDLASHDDVIAHSITIEVEPDVALNSDNDTVVDGAQDEDLIESTPTTQDPDTEARIRWMRINRRFKFIITAVAVLFSLLLFCILISWVMLTATYVLSHNKSCDVPLKGYFWLVSFQLMLDVFRADIMKWLCRWRSDSQRRVPPRVIMYNVAYVSYISLRFIVVLCTIYHITHLSVLLMVCHQ